MGYVVDGPVGKNAAKAVVSESKEKSNGFKKGGKARKARASGGGVLSSAAGGTPRGKTPKPY